MTDVLVRAAGWRGAVLHGDPCVADRGRWLRERLRGGDVRTLDAGCGSGAFALYAASRGNDVVGISFDARLNAVARRRAAVADARRVRFVDGDLRELDRVAAGWPPFDQILCLETIEHVVEDAKLLRDLAGLLVPRGRLLLTTPFAGYRALVGDALDGRDGGHVRWGYTHAELRALLRDAGLQVVEESWVSGVVSQRATNVMRRLDRIAPHAGWAATLPLRVLRPLDRPLTRALSYPYLCVGVVAERSA